jgi:hypothetical protein
LFSERYKKMSRLRRFYTYVYLRRDGTPYYIGKGTGNRCYKKGGRPCGVPSDASRIVILKNNLSEADAFKHEVYMIFLFGRKDLGTGILRNKTNGGDGSSGRICSGLTRQKISLKLSGRVISAKWRENISKGKKNPSAETREKISRARKGRKLSEETKRKISENSCQRGVPRTEEEKDNIRRKLQGRSRPEEVKKKLRAATLGRKHWVNKKGDRKHQRECPGSGWQNGRKWREDNAL